MKIIKRILLAILIILAILGVIKIKDEIKDLIYG